MSAIHRPACRAVLLACACALVSLPAVAGELYQWKDANGVTHYSDSPPPDRQYQSRAYANEAGTAVAAADETPVPEASSQCTTARANLALLQGDGPVGMDNDKDGKPDSQLSAEQRASQTALAEAAIKVHCAEAAAATTS